MKSGAKAIFGNARPIPCRTTHLFARNLAAGSLAAFLVVVTALEGRSATVDQATQMAAKSLEAKLQILNSNETQPNASPRAVVITENEANSYLKIHSSEFLPLGVGTPALGFRPEHATAAADVDFEALSRSYPNPNDWGPKVLAAMFKGTQRVTVTAKIQPENAGARVQIESVVVGSMVVPNWLVDYVIQNVLQPRYHFDLSKPLAYPDHVTLMVLGSRQTIFLRGPKSDK